MATATLYIDGVIATSAGWFDDGPVINQKYIRDQLAAFSDYDDVLLIINSPGGEMFEGWAIYDHLLTLGKPINTRVVGNCMSMATVLFLLGTDRMMSPNSKFMYHLPSAGAWGNRVDMEKVREVMDEEEERLLDLYAEKTGKDKEVFRANMEKGDTFLTTKEAIAEGFATGIYTGVENFNPKALRRTPVFAWGNFPTVSTKQDDRMKKQTKSAKALAKQLKDSAEYIDAVSSDSPEGLVNLSVTTNDGTKLEIETKGETIAVGNIVKREDGSDANGTHTLSDGRIITVEDGAITDIQEADDTPDNQGEPPAEEQQPPAVPTNDASRITALENAVKKFEKLFSVQNAQLKQYRALLGATLSADVDTVPDEGNVPQPRPVNKTAQEREQMLKKHLEQYGVKPSTN